MAARLELGHEQSQLKAASLQPGGGAGQRIRLNARFARAGDDHVASVRSGSLHDLLQAGRRAVAADVVKLLRHLLIDLKGILADPRETGVEILEVDHPVDTPD